MPYMLDRLTVNQAHAVLEPTAGRSWNGGLLHRSNRPLAPEEADRFASRFRLDVRSQALKEIDFIRFADSEVLVSSRVLQHLQELEPDVHQILPFASVDPPPIVSSANLSFGLINCCKFEDFIDITGSRLIASKGPDWTTYVYDGSPVWAKSSWRPNGHFWRSASPVLRLRHFVSDELRERLEGLGVESWKFIEVHLS